MQVILLVVDGRQPFNYFNLLTTVPEGYLKKLEPICKWYHELTENRAAVLVWMLDS